MKYFSTVDVTAARFAALISAMVIYAVCGSPSPDNPGLWEILIGVLLVLAVGAPQLRNVFVFDPARPVWQSAGWFLFIYGFVVVLPVAALHGNDLKLILRDLAPFLFLLLPLLAGDIFEKRPEYFRTFLFTFAFMGLAFAVRALGEAQYFNRSLAGDTKELYYFANAPSVLFAAVFPAGFVLEKYLRTQSLRSAGLLIVAAACIFFPLLALSITLQRASIFWAALCLAAFAGVGFYRAPYRMLVFLPVAAIIFLLEREHILTVFEHLSHKTAVYGVNKRGAEMGAAWREISGNFLSIFSGIGWGGTFESPAVGGARINFTHSFISGMMLKTGLIGLSTAVIYVSGFFKGVYGLLRRDIVLALALAGPLVIDVFLYASYKWLDFGLLLLLIMAARVASQRCLMYSL